jgi:hypothetical protein
MARRLVHALLNLLLVAALLVPGPAFAKGGGGFRGGGGSFSGGSRAGGFGGSRSFSSPKAPSPANPGTFKPARPPGGFTTRYDSGAASAQRAQSSKSLYERANGIFNGGRTTNVERVGPVSDETIQTRPARTRSIFGSYTTQPVSVVYHDSFNPWFWMWLLDRGQRDRDLWVYNHRDEMDDNRYHDLLQKDSDLERRLHDLEQQGVPHDSSYTPPGVDQDLMYDDNHVQQAYAENRSHPQWGLFLVLLAGAAFAYLIFFVPMFKPRRRAY